MKTVANQKLITCIIPRGRGREVLLRLKREKGIVSANVNAARGGGRSFMQKELLGTETEKEIVNVVVDAQRADEIFAFLHEHAGIGESHGGLIFLTRLKRSTLFSLPANLPEQQ